MTDQSSEILKVGDEKLYINQVQPLEDFFTDGKTTPAKHWNLTLLSTAENRGYCGYWEIKNKGLYLVSIFTYRITRKGFWFWKKYTYPELTVTDLFPDAVNGEIKATWFTGGFSGYTKTTKNPVDDRLSVRFDHGDLVSYQWFHLNGKGDKGATPYEKALP
jgi:hypothetical protein